MDQSEIEKSAQIVAKKLDEGYTEDQAREVLKNTGFSESEVMDIMVNAKMFWQGHSKSANLETAFPPHPMPPQPVVTPQAVQQPKGIYSMRRAPAGNQDKSHNKTIIGVVAVIIIIILLLLLALTQGWLSFGGIAGRPAGDGGQPAGNGTSESSAASPGQPQEPPETDEFGNIIAEGVLETEVVKVEMPKIILSDDGSSVDEIELSYSQTGQLATNEELFVSFEIWKGDSRESTYAYAVQGYLNAYFKMTGLQGSDRVFNRYPLVHADEDKRLLDPKTDCMVYYDIAPTSSGYKAAGAFACRSYNPFFTFKCASLWYPCSLPAGDYDMRAIIARKNTRRPERDGTLGILKKSFTLGPGAEKVQ